MSASQKIICFTLCVLIELLSHEIEAFPRVSQKILSDNIVVGFKKYEPNGRKDVEHYLGIPFAKPPIGNLRFKAPVDIGYFGKRMADKLAPACWSWPTVTPASELSNPSTAIWYNNTAMQEDCLYLNVWTPSIKKLRKNGDKKAVMVWIFGGGFWSGSASLDIYNGAILASMNDIIIVSMQYRLGPLGFLHLGTYEAPGNMGLMDQQLALKWVNKNIHFFGGDPSRVTIFGESAGSVSVSYHLLSPTSQQYVKRAIMQSGTAAAWWAIDTPSVAKKKAIKLAKVTGCHLSGTRPDRITKCLRKLRAQSLVDKTTDVLNWMNRERNIKLDQIYGSSSEHSSLYHYFDVPFRPTTENKFMPMSPLNVLERGLFKDADVLLGVVKNEAVFWLVYGLPQYFLIKNKWVIPYQFTKPLPRSARRHFTRLGRSAVAVDPGKLVRDYILDVDNLDPVVLASVLTEYDLPSAVFKDKKWKAFDIVAKLDDLGGDHSFKCPTVHFADFYANKSQRSGRNVWMYSFEHHSRHLSFPKWTGAMHGYELDYVFGQPLNKFYGNKFYNFTDAERQLSRDIMQYWTNFASTGDPNRHPNDVGGRPGRRVWPKYSNERKNYIILKTKRNGKVHKSGINLRKRQCKFWYRNLRTMNALLKNKRCRTP